MDDEKRIKEQLNTLQDQHRGLDRRISEGSLNMIEAQRLKKLKLALKDQIRVLESMLYSDIIA